MTIRTADAIIILAFFATIFVVRVICKVVMYVYCATQKGGE